MISGNEILVTLVVVLFSLPILETRQLRKSFVSEEVTLLNRIFISTLEFYDKAMIDIYTNAYT